MPKHFFDYDDGDFAMSISDNMAMDSDGDIMMRMGDHMAMDMDTGDIHMISSWQIFFRDPIPADAEGAAPLHDLCRDLGQIFLAEAGLPKVGVKVCDW